MSGGKLKVRLQRPLCYMLHSIEIMNYGFAQRMKADKKIFRNRTRYLSIRALGIGTPRVIVSFSGSVGRYLPTFLAKNLMSVSVGIFSRCELGSRRCRSRKGQKSHAFAFKFSR